MKKMIAVLKRKPGMTFEEFTTYYDTRHVPLVKGLMGDNLVHYIRNFVDSDSPFAVGVKLDFDCVTEFHFVDDAAFERAVKAVEHPDNAPKVRACVSPDCAPPPAGTGAFGHAFFLQMGTSGRRAFFVWRNTP